MKAQEITKGMIIKIKDWKTDRVYAYQVDKIKKMYGTWFVDTFKVTKKSGTWETTNDRGGIGRIKRNTIDDEIIIGKTMFKSDRIIEIIRGEGKENVTTWTTKWYID